MNIQLEAYTYFETKSGLLAYSYGNEARYDDGKLVCSIVGYFSDKRTGRKQVTTGKYVEKLIWEGNEGNWTLDEHLTGLPKKVRDEVHNYTFLDKNTLEKLVLIPADQIAKLYSPKESLSKMLSKEVFFDEKRFTALKKLVKKLERIGILRSDLGLYGSMQMGIYNESLTTDIDLLIYGLKNYPKLIKLTHNQPQKVTLKSKHKSINEFEPWRRARERRDRDSKIFIDDTTHADVRLVRKPGDPCDFDFHKMKLESGIVEFTGTVTMSNQGLSEPSVFFVKSENTEYVVGTRMYVYLGSAGKGDKVSVRGRKLMGKHSILVGNARDNYIYAIN